MPNPRLSILICHLNKRKDLLKRFADSLQAWKYPEVAVQILDDNGEMTIGAKRQTLLSEAKGDYVAFADDDDYVSKDYLSSILAATESNPDVVGIWGKYTTDGANPKRFLHSLACSHWYEKNGIYYRNPNHLNPIKREIAQQVKYKHISFGEDHQWSKDVQPLLKTQRMAADHPIYFYDYRTNK